VRFGSHSWTVVKEAGTNLCSVKSPIGAAAMVSGDYTRADAERIATGIAANP
jgi:hypothetical protein